MCLRAHAGSSKWVVTSEVRPVLQRCVLTLVHVSVVYWCLSSQCLLCYTPGTRRCSGKNYLLNFAKPSTTGGWHGRGSLYLVLIFREVRSLLLGELHCGAVSCRLSPPSFPSLLCSSSAPPPPNITHTHHTTHFLLKELPLLIVH